MIYTYIRLSDATNFNGNTKSNIQQINTITMYQLVSYFNKINAFDILLRIYLS